MVWTIEYHDTAKRRLKKLDRQVAKRIADFLDHRLAAMDDPRMLGEQLTGRLREYWRYRVGDCRLICSIDNGRLLVLVVEIGHRREVYR